MPQIPGRAVIHATDRLYRPFQRDRRDLREHGLHTLADRRRADINRYRPIGLEIESHVLPRAGPAAFQVAPDRNAVEAAVDQASAQLELLQPVKFGEATVQGDLIIATVGFGLRIERHDFGEAVRHLGFRNQVPTPECDLIDAEIAGSHVEQSFAEEIRLETTRPAIGAGGRLVGHNEVNRDMDVGNTVGT